MLSYFRRWILSSLAGPRRLTPRRRSHPPYRGPGKTLFIYDGASRRWLVVTWDGAEVSLPAEDLEGFVEHLLRS